MKIEVEKKFESMKTVKNHLKLCKLYNYFSTSQIGFIWCGQKLKATIQFFLLFPKPPQNFSFSCRLSMVHKEAKQ